MTATLKNRLKLSNAELVQDYKAMIDAYPWERLFLKKKRQKLLDIGCGTGRWLITIQNFLREKGVETAVAGDLLDPSRRVIETAKTALKPPWSLNEQHPISIRFAELTAQSYDIVWAMHSLYAIPNYELGRVLRKCQSLLKPGGSLFIVQSSETAFYSTCYKAFRQQFAMEAPEQYITAEKISGALKAPHKSIVFSYEEKVEPEKLDTFILDECIGNSFNRDHNLGIPASLKSLQASSPFAQFLDSFKSGDFYLFPQEVHLIIVESPTIDN